MEANLPDNANERIEWYLEERPPKFHEVKLLDIIEIDYPGFSGRLLDIGCASGSFLAQARQRFPDATLEGFELSETLVELGNERWNACNIHLEVGDATAYQAQHSYDILTAQGVLSIFQEPLEVLDHWLQWLAPNGTLYIFGRFNSNPMDVRIVHRNRLDDKGWETGYTNYSLQTISEHLEKAGYEVEFEKWTMPEKIKKRSEPNRSHTVELADGNLMLVNGANLIVEQFFAKIRKA